MTSPTVTSPAARRLSWVFVLVAVALTVLAVRNAPAPTSSAAEEQPAPTCTVLCADTSGSGAIGTVFGPIQGSGSGAVGQVG